ncbi:uncharacterized protein F5147DRAFT_789477 [Suillus discolor]|uniref:Uncharacterized protein n=1 Tax=Suillus discolor TaxID=1912936 RepID=A0A9P7JM81_9AGAM|nr:uncharacterized protein F5147DRAFT_789477 [Suillus discolor]KAG2088370.1 hypothetical protein F5147DRAFT_789477 [Suillus discolor]
MDDDDEHSASQAHSSKGDQTDWTEDSDDDLYRSIISDNVDKIIIAQDSLRAFTNTICPSSYGSMTEVKFSALDGLIVKPIGIYGSKEEIVQLLLSLGVVDDYIAAQLVVNHSETSVSKPSLRSGLYIVRSDRETISSEQLFVIYWLEDAT